jgi:hypothetical protein
MSIEPIDAPMVISFSLFLELGASNIIDQGYKISIAPYIIYYKHETGITDKCLGHHY